MPDPSIVREHAHEQNSLVSAIGFAWLGWADRLAELIADVPLCIQVEVYDEAGDLTTVEHADVDRHQLREDLRAMVTVADNYASGLRRAAAYASTVAEELAREWESAGGESHG